MPELPEVRVELTHAHHLHSLGRTLTALRPIFDLSEPAEVNLDLTELTFIGPACMALMVAAVRQARETGMLQRGKVIYPNSLPVRTYLKRMNAIRVLFEHEEVEIADDVERGDVEGLKECEHFSSDAGCLRVAKGLAEAIQQIVETDTITANSLEVCLGELTENVYYHANTAVGGFAAAQTFKKSQEIELAIVDLGVGIAGSLSENPDFADKFHDDISAINTAIKPTVTATPERNSGYGLTLTRLLLEINDGRLIVWSGEGKVEFGENPTEKKVDRLPGTLVVLRLHTDRPFDLQTAYQRLERAIQEIEGSPVEDVRPLKTNTPS
jgi:anti-sigma regulatory factor (Ser/Thr protein kinase)